MGAGVHNDQAVSVAFDLLSSLASLGLVNHIQSVLVHLPLGKKLRTRTTTRTLPGGDDDDNEPPPSGTGTGTATLSLARRDGLDAVERNVAADAVDGLVIPVPAETPDEDAEDWEPGPLLLPWPWPWPLPWAW